MGRVLAAAADLIFAANCEAIFADHFCEAIFARLRIRHFWKTHICELVPSKAIFATHRSHLATGSHPLILCGTLPFPPYHPNPRHRNRPNRPSRGETKQQNATFYYANFDPRETAASCKSEARAESIYHFLALGFLHFWPAESVVSHLLKPQLCHF